MGRENWQWELWYFQGQERVEDEKRVPGIRGMHDITDVGRGRRHMSTSPVVLKGQLGRSPWAAGQHGPHLSSSGPQRRRTVNLRGV